jgi:hypothetical protein
VIEAMTKWPKSMIALGACGAALVVLAARADATDLLGPNPALCTNGSAPSVLVKITGLKHRNGTIRVRAFTGDPKTYFDKKHAYRRVQYTLRPG